MRRLLRRLPVPKVAVAPIVGGRALKGPAAKMMREMGLEVSPLTVAMHYADFLTGFVLDVTDGQMEKPTTLPVLATDTIMTDLDSKARLAETVVSFAAELRAGHRLAAPDPASQRPLP